MRLQQEQRYLSPPILSASALIMSEEHARACLWLIQKTVALFYSIVSPLYVYLYWSRAHAHTARARSPADLRAMFTYEPLYLPLLPILSRSTPLPPIERDHHSYIHTDAQLMFSFSMHVSLPKGSWPYRCGYLADHNNKVGSMPLSAPC